MPAGDTDPRSGKRSISLPFLAEVTRNDPERLRDIANERYFVWSNGRIFYPPNRPAITVEADPGFVEIVANEEGEDTCSILISDAALVTVNIITEDFGPDSFNALILNEMFVTLAASETGTDTFAATIEGALRFTGGYVAQFDNAQGFDTYGATPGGKADAYGNLWIEEFNGSDWIKCMSGADGSQLMAPIRGEQIWNAARTSLGQTGLSAAVNNGTFFMATNICDGGTKIVFHILMNTGPFCSGTVAAVINSNGTFTATAMCQHNNGHQATTEPTGCFTTGFDTVNDPGFATGQIGDVPGVVMGFLVPPYATVVANNGSATMKIHRFTFNSNDLATTAGFLQGNAAGFSGAYENKLLRFFTAPYTGDGPTKTRLYLKLSKGDLNNVVNPSWIKTNVSDAGYTGGAFLHFDLGDLTDAANFVWTGGSGAVFHNITPVIDDGLLDLAGNPTHTFAEEYCDFATGLTVDGYQNCYKGGSFWAVDGRYACFMVMPYLRQGDTLGNSGTSPIRFKIRGYTYHPATGLFNLIGGVGGTPFIYSDATWWSFGNGSVELAGTCFSMGRSGNAFTGYLHTTNSIGNPPNAQTQTVVFNLFTYTI